jgi:hypothetical protein
MGYQDIELAKIRVDEARKMGLESQRAHRALSESRNKRHESIQEILHTRILTAKCFFLHYSERFYCRTLEFFFSRPV